MSSEYTEASSTGSSLKPFILKSAVFPPSVIFEDALCYRQTSPCGQQSRSKVNFYHGLILMNRIKQRCRLGIIFLVKGILLTESSFLNIYETHWTKTRYTESRHCLANDFNNLKQFWKRINSIINRSTKSSSARIRVSNEIVTDLSMIFSICSSQISPVLIFHVAASTSCVTHFSFLSLSPSMSKFRELDFKTF